MVAVVVDDLSAWMLRGDLWNLERAQADLTAEADDKLVAVGVGRAAELFALIGVKPAVRGVVVVIVLDAYRCRLSVECHFFS